MKQNANRNEQFEIIAQLKATYAAAGNPAVSMDTKKKALEIASSIYIGGYWADPKMPGGVNKGKRYETIADVKEDVEVEAAKNARVKIQRAKRKKQTT